MTTEDKHVELRERIAAGERRNEGRRELVQYAREATENAAGFVKEHPVATVVGGIAVGLAVGALTSRGRKMGAKAGRGAGLLATAATELGMLYATRLMERHLSRVKAVMSLRWDGSRGIGRNRRFTRSGTGFPVRTCCPCAFCRCRNWLTF